MIAALKKYVQLTKPAMVAGNLVTAAGGYFLAARGDADAVQLFYTLAGIGLVVASACVFNNCIDRRIDRKMARTRHRALASGDVTLPSAITWATVLALSGAAILWAASRPLCLAVVLAGFMVYVIMYSLLLKPKSVHSTLVGSLAGAAPAMAGYFAAAPRFDTGAAILLAVFSLWQIPHTYAIALFRRDDYTAAAIPLLPILRGAAAARKHIIGYVLVFLLIAPMLSLFGYTGIAYLGTALLVGLVWLALAWAGDAASDEMHWARRLYVFSLVGITVLTVVMAADAVRFPAVATTILNR